ncbi:MAG: DNA-3-methyladenine glycosylase [Candidatus Baltobacteraceae bacterium]
MRLRRLRRAELPLETAALARFLIGAVVVRETGAGRLAGRIVETEAYVPGDASSHAFRGETGRNRSMFLRRGHAYVYFIYGTSYCLNVSSDRAGIGAAVLLRAAEPLAGIDEIERLRGDAPLRDLLRGPGRLAAGLGIDRRHDGLDLCAKGSLWLAAASGASPQIGESVRIGLKREAHRTLRYYERGSPFVSGPSRLNV